MMQEVSCDTDTPPERPSESDCCNNGCTPCVFDIYERQLAEWRKRRTLGNKSNKIRYDLLSKTKFKPFTVLKKVCISSDTHLIRFQPKLTNEIKLLNTELLEETIMGTLPYIPGQHFIMKTNYNKNNHSSESNFLKTTESDIKLDSETTDYSVVKDRRLNSTMKSFLTRAYTPITLSSEEHNCCYDIVFKLYENGQMSNYIKTLDIGDVTFLRGPYGEFHYIANSYKMILMLCIGTGIAPVYAVSKHILSDCDDESIVKLYYGSRKVEDIILREELQNFTLFWNFTLNYYISNNCTENVGKRFGENFTFNRMNDDEIIKIIKQKKSLDSTLILICGTEEFSQNVLHICIENGISRKHIHIF